MKMIWSAKDTSYPEKKLYRKRYCERCGKLKYMSGKYATVCVECYKRRTKQKVKKI